MPIPLKNNEAFPLWSTGDRVLGMIETRIQWKLSFISIGILNSKSEAGGSYLLYMPPLFF